jgi:hypothetical protein
MAPSTALIDQVRHIVIPSAFRTIMGAKPEKKLRVFELQAQDLMGYVRRGMLDRADVIDALQEMANETGLLDIHGQDEIQAIMADAAEAGQGAFEQSKDSGPTPHYGISQGPEGLRENPGPVEPTSLNERDAGDDPGPIPPRGWLLANQFCRRFLSSIVAAGGTGKTAATNAAIHSNGNQASAHWATRFSALPRVVAQLRR